MASLEVHFVDDATGQCVQTLRASREDMTALQIAADLTANKPADRTLAYPAKGHVCLVVPPTQAQTDLQAKSDQLKALRDQGWANLSDADKVTARALAFDLGMWAPA